MGSADADSLAEWRAVQSIQMVIANYFRAIDAGDLEGVRSCYFPDAAETRPGYSGDLDGFIDYCAASFATRSQIMHFVGNVPVSLVDTVHAEADYYALAFHPITGEADAISERITGIRYTDQLLRRGDQWRFIARSCRTIWSRVTSVQSSWSS